MATSVRRWRRWGFLPEEAMEFRKISQDGLHAPYVEHMVRRRISMLGSAKRNNWSEERLLEQIKKDYKRYTGGTEINKSTVWQYMRGYEEERWRTGEEYESPWVKRTRRNNQEGQKRNFTTKRTALESWIKQLDGQIDRTTSESRRAQLKQQRANLQEQLDKLE